MARLQNEKEPPSFESVLEDISCRHKTLESGFSTNEDEDKDALEDTLSEFYDTYCVVQCKIPGNELRKAYTETELGFKITAMPPKKDSGEYQYADYAFEISVNGDEFKPLNIRFERKAVPDLNITILNHWLRFKKELAKSKGEDFRIVVEGSMIQTLTFFYPYPKKCKYCMNSGYRIKEKKRSYYCKINGNSVNYNSSCSKLILKKRSNKQIAQLIAFKRKRIGIIEAMRFPIVWCDTRANTAQYINSSVKQFFIVNYAGVLGL